MRSDVTLGAALSGGVDSSAVVCAMRYVEPTMPIKTFSFIAGTSDISEEGWVDLVNQHVGAISHKVRVTPKELVTDLDKMIQAQGEPFGSTSIYAQFRVYQMARENGIKVMLDGQGADEMLAGYIGYPGKRLRSLIETWQLNSAYEFWRNWSSWPGRNHMMAARYLATEMTNGRVYELLRKIDGKENIPRWINREILNEYGVNLRKKIPKVNTSIRGRRVMDELKYSLTTRGLNGLLRHADRNSMIFGIESRVPFLTHGMAELLLTMPEDYLISKMGETKHIFRHAMKGIVPEVILNRKDKIGFATDEINLINGMSGEPRHWIIDNLNLPFINKKQLICQFDSIMLDKRSYSWQVWRWINFARWQALFGV
jgi:asparagine synthase (glutamine-hydrolysing)